MVCSFRKETPDKDSVDDPGVSDSAFAKPEYKDIEWERPSKKTVKEPDVQSFLNFEKY